MLTDDQLLKRAGAKAAIKTAMECFYNLDAVKASIGQEHITLTPDRIAKSWIDELYKGCWEDPKEVLRTKFADGDYDEIVYVNDITVISMCAHHALPFFGKAHFGYLPDKSIVGLSKIPRLIECFARRPQVQEKLTEEIVDTFMEVMQPKGCGVVIECYHLCMNIRGVQDENAYTKTTALRGLFKKDPKVKGEYLDGIRKTTEKIWP